MVWQTLCQLCLPSRLITFFLESRTCGPAGWLAMLLIKAGDVETNPGPTTTRKQVWFSNICHRQIQVRKQISIRCNRIEHWVHLRCTLYRYLNLPSTQIIQTHNTHRHNTTPHSPTLSQAAHPFSPNTTHTPPQPKHRHISHFPHVPPELVKPKPNPVTHSRPTPPTPPEPNTYTCHTLHLHLSAPSSLARHTTIDIRHDYRLQQNRRTFTNYKKPGWTQFTEGIESAFAQTTIPTNIHTANIIFTNIILMADKHNTPKEMMRSNCRLLPKAIVCKINNINIYLKSNIQCM